MNLPLHRLRLIPPAALLLALGLPGISTAASATATEVELGSLHASAGQLRRGARPGTPAEPEGDRGGG
jgi:hypothetical protein